MTRGVGDARRWKDLELFFGTVLTSFNHVKQLGVVSNTVSGFKLVSVTRYKLTVLILKVSAP